MPHGVRPSVLLPESLETRERLVPLRRRLAPVKAAALSRVFARGGVGPERLRALRLRQPAYSCGVVGFSHHAFTGLIIQGGGGRGGFAPMRVRVEGHDEEAIPSHPGTHRVRAGKPGSRYGARGEGSSICLCDPRGSLAEPKGPAQTRSHQAAWLTCSRPAKDESPHRCGLSFIIGAQKRTRTSTELPPLAPEASASTNSATWAGVTPLRELREPRNVGIGRRLVNSFHTHAWCRVMLRDADTTRIFSDPKNSPEVWPGPGPAVTRDPAQIRRLKTARRRRARKAASQGGCGRRV